MSFLFGCFLNYLGRLGWSTSLSSCSSTTASHAAHEGTKARHQFLLFEPIWVCWRPRSRFILLQRWPIEVQLHRTQSSWFLHLLGQSSLEVTHFEKVEFENFVGKEVDLGLLQVTKLWRQEHLLFFLDLFGNELPLLFELEALIIVFDTPFVTALSHLFLCWFWHSLFSRSFYFFFSFSCRKLSICNYLSWNESCSSYYVSCQHFMIYIY